MTKETKHLWYWWFEWLKRLLRTSYHLANRNAYRKWKTKGAINKAKKLHRSINDIDAEFTGLYSMADFLNGEPFH